VIASRALLAPVALLAITVLIVNDHVLKGAMPGLVTGKLSDLAGMIFFPLLLVAAIEQLRLRCTHRTVTLAALATGVVFAAIKLSPLAGAWYRSGLGLLQWPFRALAAVLAGDATPALSRVQLTADPSDLIVLPALLVPVLLARAVTTTPLRGDADRPADVLQA